MASETPAVGGTVTSPHGFEITSNSETPEQMRAALGIEEPEKESGETPEPKEAKAERKPLKPIKDAKTKADAAIAAIKADATGRLHRPDGTFHPKGEKVEAKPKAEAKPEVEEEPEKAEEKVEAKPEEEPKPEPQDREEREKRKRDAAWRVRQATGQAAELKRRLEALEQENARLKSGSSPESQPVSRETDGAPDPNQYRTVAEYLDARDSYNRKQWQREEETKRRHQEFEREVSGHVETFRKAIEKAGGEEFYKTLDPDLVGLEPSFVVAARGERVTPLNALADEILRAGENAPRLLAYLTEHDDVIQRLSTLPPPEFLREMGRIEAHIEAATTGAPAARVEVSKAKPPVKPVKGAPTVSEEFDETQDTQDFKSWATKVAAKRGIQLPPRR